METPYTPDTLRALIARGPWTQTDALKPYADAWQAQVLELGDALLALTPGGSEFVGSPQRCLEFIKDRMATVMKVAATNKTLQAELAAAKAQEEALALIADIAADRDGYTGDAEKLGALVDEIRRYALDPADAARRYRGEAASSPPGEEGTTK